MKLRDEWVGKIFKIWQVRYTHKWTSAIDGVEELAVEEWAKGLAGLSPEQISHGLSSWKEAWPPALSEFRDCCEGKGTNEFGLDFTPECYRAPEIRKSRLLSSDDRERRRESSKSKIAGLRAALHVKH